MNGHRKPRQQRERTNPLIVAMNHAGKLTRAELSAALQPARGGHQALRAGVASEDDWMFVVSAMNVADSIELQGIVRGVRAHVQAAQHALQAIAVRAYAGGTWLATSLSFAELEDIDAGMDVHAYQLGQLSYGEYRRALDHAIADVQRGRGRIVELSSRRNHLAGAAV